ncbi:exodeoxyribonuclease V subunit gamma [Clostridium sp. D2Q-11]|uniref:Exodeoxyribonuclease V subunit gamma n=1 Tax=Anaeromonas frigoriresistens TaxID=2683708 RepID=A0A942V357_9FIRM|nr:PD-(D/E)XK nuclease family protein [Anaeromonas frigoriresistens]MBS4539102.1 exodeoxyribonuclease V subunit gamma [Anaeromonas frigoriresistens]
MGEKIVYFGDINNKYNETLIDKAKKYIRESNCEKFYYILPSGNLLNVYRKRLLEDTFGALNLNVITFDDVVNKFVNQSLYTKIDDGIKETIISNIVSSLYEDGKINYYKKQVENHAFIQSLVYIIGEIKRSLVTVDDIKNGIKEDMKYTEVWNIYEKYQDFLKENSLLDNEEVYMMASNNLENSLEIFKELDSVIIDEFFDFRPQEFYIIDALSKLDIDIYINIPYKFDKDFTTIKDTLDNLSNLGFSIVNIENNSMDYFDKLSYRLFSQNNKLNKTTEQIKLIKADNIELEIHRIVDDIKETIDKGVDPEKIGIITNYIDLYKDIIYKELDECRIPCSINKNKNMIDIPIAKYILNLLKVKISKYDIENVIELLKSNYLNIELDLDKDIAENILYDIHIKYPRIDIMSALDKEVNNLEYKSKANDNEKYSEELKKINIIKEVLDNIIEDISTIPNSSNIKDTIEIIKSILFKYGLGDNIAQLYEIHKIDEIYYRDIYFVNNLNTIFDKLKTTVDITIKGKVKIKEVYDILFRLFSDEELTIKRGNKKGVQMITPSTSRGLEFEKIYIVGLREGKYPKKHNSNWFFNDRNREVFNSVGIKLKNYREIYDKESLLFSIAISRATRELVLTYSGEKGSDSSIPSIFVEAVLNKIDGKNVEDKLKYEEVNINYLLKEDLTKAAKPSDVLRSLMFKHYNGQDILDVANMYNSIDNLSISDIYRNISVEDKRYSKNFTEYDGCLNDPKVICEIDTATDNIYSITQLETYGDCPMKYYFKYILKIDINEKDIEDFNSMDKGNIYHKVLADYYSIYKEKIYRYIDGMSSDMSNLDKDIHKIFIRVVQNEIGVKDIQGIWKLRIEFMQKIIIDLIKKDINRLKEKGLYPHSFESKFGYDGDFQIQTEDNVVKLLGKIDRIDVRGNEAIVYDYKTSYGKSIKDILDGTSLQIPVYLMALKAKGYNPIAGGYITIKDGGYSHPMVKRESINLVDEKKSLNDEEWQQVIETTKAKINKYINGIKSGDFKVKPTNCSPYCPFKNICRYNKERIQLKEEKDESYIKSTEGC